MEEEARRIAREEIAKAVLTEADRQAIRDIARGELRAADFTWTMTEADRQAIRALARDELQGASFSLNSDDLAVMRQLAAEEVSARLAQRFPGPVQPAGDPRPSWDQDGEEPSPDDLSPGDCLVVGPAPRRGPLPGDSSARTEDLGRRLYEARQRVYKLASGRWDSLVPEARNKWRLIALAALDAFAAERGELQARLREVNEFLAREQARVRELDRRVRDAGEALEVMQHQLAEGREALEQEKSRHNWLFTRQDALITALGNARRKGAESLSPRDRLFLDLGVTIYAPDPGGKTAGQLVCELDDVIEAEESDDRERAQHRPR
jgi:hypothetical protein